MLDKNLIFGGAFLIDKNLI